MFHLAVVRRNVPEILVFLEDYEYGGYFTIFLSV